MEAPPLYFNNYETLDVFEGGMAFVYLCNAKGGHGGQVAIKRLKSELASNPRIARLFLKECFIWMQLGQHSNVVQALSAHAAPNEPPMVVLEFVPTSLRNRLEGTPLDLGYSVILTASICAGMAYVASEIPGFVHCDLKPENILIGSDGTAKVTDFGLARIIENQSSGENFAGIGTPMYMAPEQIQHQKLSAATDIYATGCILFEAICGQPLFGFGRSNEEYLACHVATSPPDPLQLNPDIPPSLKSVLSRCLAKDPSERYRDFDELRRAIKKVAASDLHVKVPPKPKASKTHRQMFSSCQGLKNIGLYDEAIEATTTLIASEQDASRLLYAHLLLVELYSQKQEFERARSVLLEAERILERNPDKPAQYQYHTEAGRLAVHLGNQEEALDQFLAAAKVYPEGSVAWNNLSAHLANMGHFDEAIKVMHQAINIAKNWLYFKNLAYILAKHKNDFAEALNVLENAMEIHGHLPEPYVDYIRISFLKVARKRPMTIDELKQTVISAQRAARRARELGMPDEEMRESDEFVASLIEIVNSQTH